MAGCLGSTTARCTRHHLARVRVGLGVRPNPYPYPTPTPTPTPNPSPNPNPNPNPNPLHPTREQVHEIARAEGDATVHSSGLLHGVTRMRRGTRYSMIMFFSSSTL